MHDNRNQQQKLNSRSIKAKKKRKRMRRIKQVGTLLFLLTMLAMLYVVVVGMHPNKTSPVADTKRIVGATSDQNLIKPKSYSVNESKDQIQKLAQNSADYQKIYNQFNSYPKELLEALCSNSELLDFTLGYLDKDSNVSGGLTKEELQEQFPLFMQWDKRWGYISYGDSCIGLAGCAPTCLSMVIVALTHNEQATPGAVATYAQQSGYYLADVGTSWSFMTEGASHFGIKGTELSLSKSSVISELQAGHPVICSMRPGDFTSQGHFITLVGVQDGKIIVNDPNSAKRSSVLWDFDTLKGQIKNLWVYKK